MEKYAYNRIRYDLIWVKQCLSLIIWNYIMWKLFEFWLLMFILKWINFLDYSSNLNCDIEIVLIMLKCYEVYCCHNWCVCLMFINVFLVWKLLYRLKLYYLYKLIFLIVWKFWFINRINGTLLVYKKFRVWGFYKLGYEWNW